MRTLLIATALVVFAVAAPQLAYAQLGSTSFGGHSDNPNGPTVSPYLNLLNNNNQLNGVPTYQSLVKPLVDQRAAIQRQGNAVAGLQQSAASRASGGGASGTGHTSYFMNFSHYYPVRGRR